MKVKVDTPPVRIGVGENRLEICGGRRAVREAVAKPVVPVLVPVSVDETNPLTF